MPSRARASSRQTSEKKPRASQWRTGESTRTEGNAVAVAISGPVMPEQRFVSQAQQIACIIGVGDRVRLGAHLVNADVSHIERDLLEAGDLEALAQLDDLHEVGGLEERVGRAGVEPRHAATKPLHMELAAFEI